MSQPKEEAFKRSSWKLWWDNIQHDSRDNLRDLQRSLMDELDFEPGISVENSMSMGQINQWRVSNPAAKAITVPTLLIHGYAATSMTYFRNFEQLSRSAKDLYAIDLPGNGLSKELPLEPEGINKPKRLE